jgi:hypothetical protein
MLERQGVSAWPCQYMAVEMGDQSFPRICEQGPLCHGSAGANTLYLPLATIFQIADSRIAPVDSRTSWTTPS